MLFRFAVKQALQSLQYAVMCRVTFGDGVYVILSSGAISGHFELLENIWVSLLWSLTIEEYMVIS